MCRKMLTLFTLTLTLLSTASVQAGQGDGHATAKGSLDKDLIRNVIRRHINEVKQCYEAQLAKNKDLAGRVMVRFTINPDGKVTESSLEESTLKNAAVETCIVESVRTFEFPKPRGGHVVVSYPFVLASGPPNEEAGK